MDSFSRSERLLHGRRRRIAGCASGKLPGKTACDESEGWATPRLDRPPGKPPQLGAAGARKMDGLSAIAFGCGAPPNFPFSCQLERKDKNKGGEITEDEWIEHICGGMALVSRNLDAQKDLKVAPLAAAV